MVKLYHPESCQNSDVLSIDNWEKEIKLIGHEEIIGV